MKKSIILVAVSLFIANTSAAECWANQYNRDCCSSNAKVIYTDSRGQWGYQNGRLCGIAPKRTTKKTTTTLTPTTTKNCPLVTFPLDRCTNKGGRSTRITVTGCSVPTCVFDEECWSEELGFPCCSYYIDNVVSSDANGDWSTENGKKCGIRGTRRPIITTTTTTTTTTTRNCPLVTFPLDRCVNKGGRSTRITVTGCSVPTCVFDEECWSEELGFPCCSYYIDDVVYSDANGDWSIENDKKCGIRRTRRPIITTTTTTTTRECPTVTFPLDRCVNKGGRSTRTTITGCSIPTCVFDEECWSEKLGFPCCTYYNEKIVSSDEYGYYGEENGKKCGMRGTRKPTLKTITATTTMK